MCGQHHINQQTITQTSIKLCLMDTTNTKVLCCDLEAEFCSKSEIICHTNLTYDMIFLKIAKLFHHAIDSH